MQLLYYNKYNQLILNPSKSLTIPNLIEIITLNELTSIERNCSTKFLGVILNEKLNWNEHIEVACSQIILYCYGLFKTRTTLNISALKYIYYEYMKCGIICWGNSKKTSYIFKKEPSEIL